jgi:hypothetical protein
MVGMGVGVAVGVAVLVGVAVGVAVGVLVGVAVLVGTVVAVGNDVALGAGVGIGADAGAQADNIRLTSKNTINVRFILRVLLGQSSRPTVCASPAPRSAAERRQVQARVMPPFCDNLSPTFLTNQILDNNRRPN